MNMLPVDITNHPEILRVGADEIIVHAPGDATLGDLFAVTVRMPPGGGPPVMHRHAPSEVYHVLEGEFSFYVTGSEGVTTRTAAGPGSTTVLAGRTPHTIRNEGDVDAVAFCVHAPGGPMERFSRAAAARSADGPPRMEDVLRIAQEHGIELLGPVPSEVVDRSAPAPSEQA